MKQPATLKKSIILAGAIVAASFGTTFAAPVTFWCSGTINYVNNPSNTAPSGVVVGTPFSVRFTYDIELGSYMSGYVDLSGSRSNAYFSTLSGNSVLVQMGGHTVTNLAFLPGYNTGSLHINDNYDNEDYFQIYSGHAGLAVDGNVMTNTQVDLYLKDASKTAYNSSTFPTQGPEFAPFNTWRRLSWNRQDDHGNFLFSIIGEVSQISTNELVSLNMRQLDSSTAQLAWPVGVSGFTLQSTTNLAGGNWQNVAAPVVEVGMEQTVTVSTTGAPQFYRLKK